jgi:hypothetical protein
MDVDEILQIPICSRQRDDFWSWHYDRREVFTVRSVYKMLVSMSERREAWLDGRAVVSDVEAKEMV